MKRLLIVALALCMTAGVAFIVYKLTGRFFGAQFLPTATNSFIPVSDTEVMPSEPIPSELPKPKKPPYNTRNKKGNYDLYINDEFINRFEALDTAISIAEPQMRAAIFDRKRARWVWDNFPPYNVFYTINDHEEFESLTDALAFAKEKGDSYIYYRRNQSLLWENSKPLAGSAFIDIPVIPQYPELPYGCEVTALCMLLRHHGIDVDKMELARNVDKDETPYRVSGGKVYTGNPNRGFVGRMDRAGAFGYAVYHGPIYKLLSEYMPDRALDITGCDFDDLLYFLENNMPVWIITNASYAKLAPSEFTTWHTEDGPIQVTMREHSVLVTGYDGQYIYFADPLTNNTKASRKAFIEAWEQMGRQAVLGIH